MLRYLLAPLAALVLLTASLIPDDAYARRGGGGGFRGGGGGFHGGGFRGGGGMHAGRFHGGGYRGGLRPSHPIAGRPGRPGYPIAGRPGRPGYPVAGRGYYRGYGRGRQWEPQRLVPPPMAPMALTTTATMRTAIGSVPISINIETRRAHADGGWARPYRRPFLRYMPLARRAGHAAN